MLLWVGSSCSVPYRFAFSYIAQMSQALNRLSARSLTRLALRGTSLWHRSRSILVKHWQSLLAFQTYLLDSPVALAKRVWLDTWAKPKHLVLFVRSEGSVNDNIYLGCCLQGLRPSARPTRTRCRPSTAAPTSTNSVEQPRTSQSAVTSQILISQYLLLISVGRDYFVDHGVFISDTYLF